MPSKKSGKSHSLRPTTMTDVAHMVVCVLTLGFAFPNAFAESIDIPRYEATVKTKPE